MLSQFKNNKLKTLILFLSLSLMAIDFGIIPCAYANKYKHNANLWFVINYFGKLTHQPKWHYLFSLDNRFREGSPSYNNTVIRLGMGYQLTTDLSLWLGYDAVPAVIANSGDLQFENRSWQFIKWRIYRSEDVTFSSRTRLEQRKNTSFQPWAYRLRERLSLIFPKAIHHKYALIITDELFFNLNKPVWVNDRTFSQNRFFIGINFPLIYDSSVDVGYLNQLSLASNINTMNHIAYFGLQIPT